MRCADCRNTISARLDGEERSDEAAAADVHLAGCPECRRFAERAAHVTRLTRTRIAEPGPDLVAAVLAAAPSLPARRRVDAVRLGLGVVGVGQCALAVSGIVAASAATAQHGGVELAGASAAHVVHESSAWNLALAVGFLWVATGTSRLAGLIPMVGAFVGALVALSAVDLIIGGRVEVGRLLTHGLVVVGLVLLVALRRLTRDGGGGAAGARVTRTTSGSGSGWSEPSRVRHTGPDEVAPTARHHAA